MPPNQVINIRINANTSGLNSGAAKATAAFKQMGNAANSFIKILNNVNTASKKAFSVLSAPAKGFGMLGGAVSRVNQYFANHNKTLALSANYYKGLVGQVSNLNRFINVLGSSVRQIGQGLQNFATVFSIYVSLPVLTFIGAMTRGLINFQDKMIEVRRTTGLSLADVGKLGEAIQLVSLTSPTPVEDLAEQAAAWGRLGIAGVNTIAMLTAASDKLMTATDLTSQQVVDDLGKIGSFYFETGEDLAKNYDKVASAINELGQKSTIGESEIIAAVLRAAPTAAQLNISLPDLLGIGTTVAERAASPERAGSQLSRALTENASNVEKFAKALGTTEEEVKRLIDTNAAQFFLDILEAIEKIPSASERVSIGNALFGGVGEKAVNALAANLPGLYDNIVLANEAFDDGTSIQREYERSLDSVKNQLGLLQNNFRYLGFTIAEQVLPYITKFAAAAIPALKAAADAFENLNEKTKLTIVAVGALIAVLGPLSLFLGSLLFSIGIITTGLTAMFTQVIGVVGGIGRFAFAIVSLLAPVTVLKAAILGIGLAFIYITNTASKAGNVLAGYITNFVQWGYNLMGGFAQGIIQGASVVYQAIGIVINSFIGLIQAFSPPKEGPLRGIRDWGKNLMGGYADGIEDGSEPVRQGVVKMLGNTATEVDKTVKTYLPSIQKSGGSIAESVAKGIVESTGTVKSGLSGLKQTLEDGVDEIIHIGMMFSDSFADVLKGFNLEGIDQFADTFSQVRSIIESVGANLGLDRFDIDKRVLDAADAVAKLVKIVQGGGSASGALQSIYDLMGGLGDETEALVNAQNKYNQANKELERIKKSISNIDDELRKEIEGISARTDLTQNQKSALIRNARFRSATRKSELDDEQEAAEDRVDVAEEEMKRQEAILRTLASLIFPAEKEKIKKESDEISDSLGQAFEIGAAEDGLEDAKDRLQKLWEETTDDANNFLTKISNAQDVWRGFIAGITGDFTGIDLEREGAEFWKGFVPGQNIKLAIAQIQEQFSKFKTAIDGIVISIKGLFSILAGGTLEGYLGLDKTALDNFSRLEKIVYNIGYFFGAAAREAEEFIKLFEGPTKNIINTIGNARGGDESQTFLQRLDFETIGRNLGIAFNNVIQKYFNTDGESFKRFTDSISATVGGIVGAIGAALAVADFTELAKGVGLIVAAIFNGFKAENINPGTISAAVQEIFNTILTFLSTVTTATGTAHENIFTNILNAILEGIATVDVSIFTDSLLAIVSGILGGLAGVDWISLGESLSSLVNNLLEALGDETLWTNLGTALGGIINGIATAIEGIEWHFASDIFAGLGIAIGAALKTMFDDPESDSEWKGPITEAVGGFITNILEFVLETIIGALTGALVDNIEFDSEGFLGMKFFDETGGELPNIFDREFWDSIFGGQGIQYKNRGNGESEGMDSNSGTDFSSSGGTVTTPVVLAPEVLQEAITSGESWNSNFVTGIGTGLKSPESQSQVANSINTLMMGTENASMADTTASGMKIGGYVVTGMSDRFAGDETQADLSTLITAMGAWVTANSTNLEFIGDTIGDSVIKGLSEALSESETFMQPAIKGMNSWLSDSSNKQLLTDVGEDLGQNILTGVAMLLADSGNLITQVLNAALLGTPLTPEQINTIMPKTRRQLAQDPETASISSFQPAIASGGNTYNVNLTFNGATPKDRKDVDNLKREILESIRKDTNIKR